MLILSRVLLVWRGRSVPRVDGARARRRHPGSLWEGARPLPGHCGEPQRAQAPHNRAHHLQGLHETSP